MSWRSRLEKAAVRLNKNWPPLGAYLAFTNISSVNRSFRKFSLLTRKVPKPKRFLN
jgi:hypothetical protein